jgi:hypothetical protein
LYAISAVPNSRVEWLLDANITTRPRLLRSTSAFTASGTCSMFGYPDLGQLGGGIEVSFDIFTATLALQNTQCSSEICRGPSSCPNLCAPGTDTCGGTCNSVICDPFSPTPNACFDLGRPLVTAFSTTRCSSTMIAARPCRASGNCGAEQMCLRDPAFAIWPAHDDFTICVECEYECTPGTLAPLDGGGLGTCVWHGRGCTRACDTYCEAGTVETFVQDDRRYTQRCFVPSFEWPEPCGVWCTDACAPGEGYSDDSGSYVCGQSTTTPCNVYVPAP